jgi:hypothetical protein
MSILRSAAFAGIVLFCAGFVPIGSCAKCGSAGGRAAARNSDDIALGVQRSTRYTGTPRYTGPAVGGAYADDLARSGRYSDDVVHGGTVADDVVGAADDVHSTNFAAELEQSGVKLAPKQNDEVLDALKDAGEQVVELLADDDDKDDKAALKAATIELDRRLKSSMTLRQQRMFHTHFGSSAEIVERLVREQKAR